MSQPPQADHALFEFSQIRIPHVFTLIRNPGQDEGLIFNSFSIFVYYLLI